MAIQFDEVTAVRAPARTSDATPRLPDAATRRRPWRRVPWTLLLVLAVATTLRAWWLDVAHPQPVSDFKHYLDAATTLVDRGFLGVDAPSAWRLPAFPAVLALAVMVSRDLGVLSGVAVALSVAQVGLTWWLALLVFRRPSAAFVAGLVAAVAPAFVFYAPVLASEHLLAVCVLGALVAAMHAGRPRWWWPATLSGVLLGVGMLTRGEAGAYLPVIMLVVAAGVWRWSPARRTAPRVRASLVAATVVAVAAAAVVMPWVARNERVVGEGSGLSTTGGFNFYLAHSPGPYGWRTPLPLPLQVEDEVLRNELGWTYGLQFVRDHPEDWAPTTARGTRELLAPSSYAAFYATVVNDGTSVTLQPRTDVPMRARAIDLAGRSSHWLLWAGLAGLALVPVWRRRAWLAVVGVVLANWVVYAVVFWAQARYRFVVDALACVSVGAVPAAVAAVLAAARGRGADQAAAPGPSWSGAIDVTDRPTVPIGADPADWAGAAGPTGPYRRVLASPAQEDGQDRPARSGGTRSSDVHRGDTPSSGTRSGDTPSPDAPGPGGPGTRSGHTQRPDRPARDDRDMHVTGELQIPR